MKKTVIIFACILLLSGCSANHNVQDHASSSDPTEAELTGNIFLDADDTSYSLEGGGISRVIKVSKEDALNASTDDYAEFLDRVVMGSGHNELYGLIFDDGTGVTYYGCSPSNAVYGKITYRGVSVEAYGYILPNEDGTYSYVEYQE